MPVDKLIPRKLNSDIDAKLIDKASMIDALNLYAGDDADGGGGVLKNIKGNTAVAQSEADSFGENSRVLGSVSDEKTGIAYFFVYSTQADYHGIWAYDPEGKLANDGQPAVRLIYRDPQFNFPSTGFVKGDIVHINSVTFPELGDEFDKDAIVFFTDNVNEPRKINAYRAYQAGGTNIYDSIYATADFITACPKTPLDPITFKFDKDVNRKISNFVKTSGFQFAYQHVYKDGFESSVSSYSDVAFPPSIINQGSISYVSHDDYNRCILYIPQPGPEIKAVKIIAKEGETGSFLLIDEIDVASLYDENENYIGAYSFYNDRITKGFSKLEVNKQFDSVPRKAEAQAVTDNRLMYGNYLDGFNSVNVDCTAQVVYRERPDDFVDFEVKTNSFIGVHIDEENTDDAASAKRKSAGFTIDTSSLPDSVSVGTSILFKVTMTPDRNWHIYNSDNSYHQSKQVGEYEKFPISSEWNTFGNNAENYTLQSDLDSGLQYLRGQTPAANENVLLLAGANDGIVGDLSLTWRQEYHPTDASQTASYPVKIGTSAANPIILNGGALLFQAGFTVSTSIQSGFAVIAAKTFEEILLGAEYSELTYKLKIDEASLVQTSESVLNHSLPVNNLSTIPQSYIGQQGNNTELSRMIMAALRTLDNRLCPIGYFVFKQATAKFRLRPVANANSENFVGNTSTSTKKAFRLALSSLTDVKPMTCYKSMFAEIEPDVSEYPFLNRWGVLDPEVEFSGEAFSPENHFSGYGDDISVDDLYLDNVNNYNIQLGAGSSFRSMIGYLRYGTDTTFDLVTEDDDDFNIGSACIFDGEGGPGGGSSRGDGGNTYDDLRMNHQGSIPICTPLVNSPLDLDESFAVVLNEIPAFGEGGSASSVNGFNAHIQEEHSPMWTGRISLNQAIGSNDLEFGNSSKFATCLPLLQCKTTPITTIESNPNSSSIGVSNIKYPSPEEDDSNLGFLDPFSVNFNYLHSNVGTTSFLSGTYSGDVFRTFKSNSNHEFGIVYYDERGRHGYVNYLSNVFVPGLSSSDRPSGSEGGPASVALTLNHQPPSWAHSFKIVYGGNSSIDSFIQYSVPNAYVRRFNSDGPPDTSNIYVSLNYLQGHPISYASSFGARSVEGGLNLYKFKEGDKLRIISTGTDNDRTYYESGIYEFDIVDLVDVAAPIEGDESSIVLVDADNQDTSSSRTQGQFLVLRDNQLANGFSYTSVTSGGDINNWKKNCVVEIYSPAKDLGEDERFYYETSNTYRVLRTPSTDVLYHSPSTIILNKGDAWFRKIAMNLKDSFDEDLIPLLETDDAESNFKSYFVEAFSATDLHRSDFKGFGRVNLINDQAKEVRREASVTYSDKSNPESSKARYTSFDINKLNFKDYDYNKGHISFLSPTSGYLIVLQSNRTSLIPVSKNVLSDASGSTNLISSNVVLGEAIEQPGVGGSDSPESVVERDDKIYYANKGEAKVYLYSKGSGAKDISTNFVGSALIKSVSSATGKVRFVGGYDSLKEEYLLSVIGLNTLVTDGVTVVPQPTLEEVSDTVGPTGVIGGPGEAEDGLSVTGFQVFVDTDGDGIIGINEFINQTEFNLDQFPIIPEGEVAVPASFAGISEIADQIVIDPTNSDDFSAVADTALNVLGIAGEANLPFVLGGAIGSFIASTNTNIETPEGLTNFLNQLNLPVSGVGSAPNPGGESDFANTFNPQSNYDLIFKLADNGAAGFTIPPQSDGVDGIVTNGELLEVASVLGLAAPEGTILNADLNLDGIVGTADLLLFLSAFGQVVTDDDYPDPEGEAFNIDNLTS